MLVQTHWKENWTFEPWNPAQLAQEHYTGLPGGYSTFYYNQIPNTTQLLGPLGVTDPKTEPWYKKWYWWTAIGGVAAIGVGAWALTRSSGHGSRRTHGSGGLRGRSPGQQPRRQLPAQLKWLVAGSDQGQIVEVAFAAGEEGVYRRIRDRSLRSDQQIKYAFIPWTKLEAKSQFGPEVQFEPWNEFPSNRTTRHLPWKAVLTAKLADAFGRFVSINNEES